MSVSTGGDGSFVVTVNMDTSKASKELNRLEQKILRLREKLSVGGHRKSVLVEELEQAKAALADSSASALDLDRAVYELAVALDCAAQGTKA